MRRKFLSVLWLTSTLIAYGFSLPTPQLRSVQLGGTGPRPVLLGAGGQPQQQGPTYSQQLTFGGPPQQQQQQFQPQQALGQFRFPPPPGSQSQTPRPILLQQGRPSPSPATAAQYGQAPIGSFPIPPTARGQQQLVYRQPAPQIAVSPTSATDDDEYEDDEYSDEQVPASIRQPVPVQTTSRPSIQRVPARQLLQVQQPTAILQQQPQRFAVPQIQQQQQQRTRQRIQQVPQAQVQAHPAPVVYTQQQQGRLGQDSRLLTSDRQTTVAPIQTLNRFMKQNEDGSITWGYENEDGTFKEETLGADCVVRGKYGYVDPDGVKREYEYQSGNPCDPNKRGQEEEEDELEDVVGQQRLAGILSARPIQLQQRQRQ